MVAEVSNGEEPITRGEVLTVTTALGTGVGASIAIEAGAATGAATIPIDAAAGGGIGASGIIGWEVGTVIGKIPKVEAYLNWLSDANAFGKNQPTGLFDPMLPHLTRPSMPDLNWTIDLGPSSTPREIWWYVPEVGDRISGYENVYSNPYDAVDIIGSSNGGGGLYFLIGDLSVV